MLTGMRAFHRDDSGKAIEKILILALIALPIIIVLVIFRNDIKEWFQKSRDELEAEAGK
jgi:Flp pilus assembly pilin Flp